jgi:hypothetical protein
MYIVWASPPVGSYHKSQTDSAHVVLPEPKVTRRTMAKGKNLNPADAFRKASVIHQSVLVISINTYQGKLFAKRN